MACNQNYAHLCDESLITIPDPDMSFLLADTYSVEEFSRILDFYLVHTPIKRDQNQKTKTRSLSDYGWKGSAALNKLESKILKAADVRNIIVLKSSTIAETAKAMKLFDRICPIHPQVLLKTESKMKMDECGKISITTAETRLACLFRHTRNALAHGEVYNLGNENMLLRDTDDQGSLAAAMCIPKRALIEWIYSVDIDGRYYQVIPNQID